MLAGLISKLASLFIVTIVAETIVNKAVNGTKSVNFFLRIQWEDNGHNELWHECAGPHVSLPRVGEKVFYFPQGQLEQIEVSNGPESPDINAQLPSYNLPSKILCEIVKYDLKADKETDELFADIILLPISKESCSTESETRQETILRQPSVSFFKILTPSDSNGHAGVIIFKRDADACFPPLGMSQNPPAQELVAKDLHGTEWTFCHVYRGKPKRHVLMADEWKKFMKEKRLVPGDACIFLRGKDGGLYIGARRAKKPDNSEMPRILSVQSMKIGVLASAYHALSSRTTFSVCYRPRHSTSSFIVPYNRYMESLKNNALHMKCMMKFEGNFFQEERRTCVVVGSGDLEPATWPGSMWKCLKVIWTDSERYAGPERVSPWDLFPLPTQSGEMLPPNPLRQQDVRNAQTIKLFGSDIVQGPSFMNNTISTFASGASTSNGLASVVSTSIAVQSIMMHHVNAHVTEVMKFGAPFGRKIDLSKYSGYSELLGELDRLFEFEGSLMSQAGEWEVVYKDENGILNLAWGSPWLEFRTRVRCIYIYPIVELDKLIPRR